MSASSAVRVTVIIPALNEEKMIGKSLNHLALSDFPTDAFEVVLVDNGSTDLTREIASAYTDRMRITVLERPGVNISALRNAGAAAAQGEILAFLDADCLVRPDWLSNAELHLPADNSGIVGGGVAVPDDAGWPSRAWYGVGYAPKNGDVAYVPSGNMLMRRADFVRLGGFDEELKTSEDWDLCSRSRAVGLPVRAAAEMSVVHVRTPKTLSEFYRRERWHGTHVLKMALRNSDWWSSLRTVWFAGYSLLCGVAMAVGVAVALSNREFAVLAISGSALVTGALACTLRKLRKVRGSRFWSTLGPLTLLHIAYGAARAHALLSIGYRDPQNRKPAHRVSDATV